MNGKKKVIYIIHDLKIGGVETALLTAMPILTEKYDFRLICLGIIDSKIKSKLKERELNSIIEYSPYNPISFVKAWRFIISFKPDLTLASLWRANFLATLTVFFNKRLAFVSFNHSTKHAHLAENIVQKASVKLAKEIWTDSFSTSNFIQSRYNLPDSPKIISFLLRNVPAKKINFNEITEHKFMFVGRIIKIKRLDLIIRFSQMLSQHGFQYKIDIYGPDEDNLWQAFEDQISQETLNITYQGPRPYDELANIYTEYHHYVQFSDYEGMSISVVEAMMSGLVCFLRPVGEIKNYSNHLQNAIHLSNISEEGLELFFKTARKVLNDPEQMTQLSKAAKENWKETILYNQDLINNIDRILM